MLNPLTLANFYGTETYTRHLGGIKLTDGALYVAKNGGMGQGAGAFWLMDKFSFPPAKVKREPFVTGKLTPDGKGGATFVMDDGNGNVLHREKIDFTDFDFANAGAEIEGFALWLVDGVLMLPSEY